ncbi:iron-containing alcohol dehydrogenase [Microbacterium sp. B2969]|uniref:Iron-containing alcohol dehydrogenase n=1 Tax=Microbacterium alkaliflavum TaxID=3248839 RepID=A0ABW7Q2R9_9MICO
MTGIGVLRLPRDVRLGFGQRHAVPALATGFGSRIAVVADPFLAATPEFREIVAAMEAAGARTLVVTDVPAELPVPAVVAAADTVRDFAPDVIVGYGGGSALDAAKVVALLTSHPGPVDAYYGENAVPGPVVPLIAVPTTAGTGSEVTPVAVVSDPGREMKVGISSPWLIPTIAIVDPELTLAAPRGVTTHSGIDAFVHAVESFTAAPLDIGHDAVIPVFVGRNDLTDAVSLQAAGLIFRALPRVLDEPGDREARADMAHGSLLAGMAFGAAGTHLSHAIQYPVGALTHTPHGLGTGALLPYVLQACRDVVPDRLAQLGQALGLDAGGDLADRAQSAVDAVADLCARIGLPVSLTELGVTPAYRDRIVELALQSRRLIGISPVPADVQVVGAIVDAAIAGDRAALRSVPTHP